jgi:hypothetical protein
VVFKLIGDGPDGVLVIDFELVNVGAACNRYFDFGCIFVVTVIVSLVFHQVDYFSEKSKGVLDQDEVMLFITLLYVGNHLTHQSLYTFFLDFETHVGGVVEVEKP